MMWIDVDLGSLRIDARMYPPYTLGKDNDNDRCPVLRTGGFVVK